VGTGTGLQVPSRAEVTVVAMENRDTGMRVGFKSQKGLVQRARGIGIDGITHVGATERHDGDGIDLTGLHGIDHAAH
jgi:hypothetical protein